MLGWGTTDVIFILHQIKKKHLAANKPLYIAFVDLEKCWTESQEMWDMSGLLGNDQAGNGRVAGVTGPGHA